MFQDLLVKQRFELRHRACSYFLLFLSFLLNSSLSIASPLTEIIEGTTLQGNIRSYFQTRNLDPGTNVALYSLGTKLHLESGSIHGFNIGAALYLANDLGANRNSIESQNGLLPVSTLHTLGEAYLKFDRFNTAITAGRQKIDTPFMNPSDAFIVPVTYFGYSIINTSIKQLELKALHVKEIKLRQDNNFQNTGQFLTNRLGVTPTNTAGTSALGVLKDIAPMKLQAWDFYLPDFFNMVYLQADLAFTQINNVQPFLSFQFALQKDIGDRLVGNVDAKAWGANLGATWGQTKFAYAFNYLPHNPGTFRNGGLLSPYSFATDALYTNSLDGGLTLKDSAFVGLAHKWTTNFNHKKTLFLELSFTIFDLLRSVGGKDSQEVNIDLTYKFKGNWKGWSIRNRLALVDSELETEDLIENRFQIQYIFENIL